jgi:hypothetical protein
VPAAGEGSMPAMPATVQYPPQAPVLTGEANVEDDINLSVLNDSNSSRKPGPHLVMG